MQFYKSNGRFWTRFDRDGVEVTCLSEKTAIGVLVSEFDSKGGIRNQVYKKAGDAARELSLYVGSETAFVDDEYKAITAQSKCGKCGKGTVVRELDLVNAADISKVPVVPLFVCRACGQKFYSMTEGYLRQLMNNNAMMFEKDEIAEKDKNEEEFVKTLNEYIIRIFASKKISRLRF